jgi:hypothetical protein
MIFGSLLGTDCTILCKSDESLSHMMSCLFLSYLVAENKHGGYMQCLNIINSTGKKLHRATASSIAMIRVTFDIKATGRYEKGISRTNTNRK